jgi:hypothetical protein
MFEKAALYARPDAFGQYFGLPFVRQMHLPVKNIIDNKEDVL